RAAASPRAQLGAGRQAAGQYPHALDAFAADEERIDRAIGAIRQGRLLEAIEQHDVDGRAGWYWQMKTLPDAPESRYLYHLLATHDFQDGLKNHRDLRIMQRNLASWALSIEAFENMVGARRLAFLQRLPMLESTLDGVDLDALEARKNELALRIDAIERDGDIVGLATQKELEQWRRIERIESVLARADHSDPMIQEMVEKTRLLKGTLLWHLNANYKARLWRARKELRDLEIAYREARRRWVLVERAREEYPARTEAFAGRVASLRPRIEELMARLATTAEAQSRYLASIAVRELEAQK